jgi:hypothetical protein
MLRPLRLRLIRLKRLYKMLRNKEREFRNRNKT